MTERAATPYHDLAGKLREIYDLTVYYSGLDDLLGTDLCRRSSIMQLRLQLMYDYLGYLFIPHVADPIAYPSGTEKRKFHVDLLQQVNELETDITALHKADIPLPHAFLQQKNDLTTFVKASLECDDRASIGRLSQRFQDECPALRFPILENMN